MAKATYWQKGDSIDFLNSTDAKIEANSVVALGTRCGIAGEDILPGETGSVFVEGVFIVPSGGTAFAIGADVFFDTDAGTAATSGTKLGWCIEAVTADQTQVKVKLG